MDPERLRFAREKLTRVFRYLEALNQHRNPAKRHLSEQPWSLRLRDLPEHSSIQRGSAKPSTERAATKRAAEDSGYILKVKRPKLTRPPEPPDLILSWIENGWEDPAKAVTVEETHE